MSIQKPPAPASVQRFESRYRWLERAAAIAVIAFIAGLFLMVRAQPAPSAAELFGSIDFQDHSQCRNGRCT